MSVTHELMHNTHSRIPTRNARRRTWHVAAAHRCDHDQFDFESIVTNISNLSEKITPFIE